MKCEIKISVILTTYNSNSSFLSKCIESIQRQTYENYELIIIDDGSSKDTQKFIQSLCRDDHRITINFINNIGVSGARNEGIKMATGDYITFVDHDDWLEPDMLSCMLSCATNYNVDYVVCANYENYNGKETIDSMFNKSILLNISKELAPFVHQTPTENTVFSYPSYFHCAWGMLIRTSIIKGTLYNQDIRIAEDVEWASRIFSKINNVYYINKPLYHYRCLGASNSHSSPISEFVPAFEQIANNLKKHPSLYPNMYLLFVLMFYQRLPIFTTGKELKTIYNKYELIRKSCKKVNMRNLSYGIRICIFLFSKQKFKCSAVVNCFCKLKEHFFYKYISG